MVRLMLLVIGVVAALAAASHAAETETRPKLRVHFLSASAEYKSEDSLKAFSKLLTDTHGAVCTASYGKDGGGDLPDLAALADADVMVVFARRMKLPEGQLALIRKHVSSGKGVVGIRTASHAFAAWPTFDKDVLGGDYKGHYGPGITTELSIPGAAREHPILTGVAAFTSPSKLYKNAEPAKDVTLLLSGRIPAGTHAVAWARTVEKTRVFYTSLGGPEDFAEKNFVTMLVNAVHWAGARDPKQ